jgi:hypothetical protein
VSRNPLLEILIFEIYGIGGGLSLILGEITRQIYYYKRSHKKFLKNEALSARQKVIEKV